MRTDVIVPISLMTMTIACMAPSLQAQEDTVKLATQVCASCHGPRGESISPAFPRLAGQHAEYLVKQLVLFKSSMREGGNAPIMHNVSTGMTFDQMEAVAAYLASR